MRGGRRYEFMSLSKEYTIYCLSEKDGWIRTKSKYDNSSLEIEKDTPVDKLMEIQFTTEFVETNNIHRPKMYKDETILFETQNIQKLKEALEKYGERPSKPYI